MNFLTSNYAKIQGSNIVAQHDSDYTFQGYWWEDLAEPVSPAEGDCYLPAETGTASSGWDGITVSEDELIVYSGGAWIVEDLVISFDADSLINYVDLSTKSTTPIIEEPQKYLTSSNTTVTYINGIGVSSKIAIYDTETLIYTGSYGQSAVAVLFLDELDNIIGYESNATQVDVTDLEITVPNGSTHVKACSLSSTLKLKIKSDLDGAVSDNTNNITTNASDIASLSNEVSAISDQLTVEGSSVVNEDHLNVTSNVNGNGEIFIQKKEYVNGGQISELYVNLRTLIDNSLTEFQVRLYAFDSSLTITAVGDLIDINSVATQVHSITGLSFEIPSGCRVGLGVESGVNIGYNGSADTSEGFNYRAGLGASSLDRAVGYQVTAYQDFSTASGFGYTAQEYKTVGTQVEENTTLIDSLNTSVLSKVPNYLYGKKIVAIGDSMVQGHSLSDSNGQTWLAKLAIRNDMTRVNYGLNGGYLSDNDYQNTDDGVINRYTSMDDDADYVLIFAGTNDANNTNVLLGADDSTDITTFNGALHSLCDGLITKYPNKKIGFITPYNRNSNYPAYVQAIVDRCAEYGIPVFNNIVNGGVCWTNAAQVSAITLDDTYHLNEAGMEYVSYKYESFLRSL